MALQLPAILAIGRTTRASRREVDHTLQADVDEIVYAAAHLKPRITEALLGEAMLAPGDLGFGWLPARADDAASLFSGTEYGALFIAEMQARFERPDTSEVLEQHVGVLPNWAVHQVRSSFDPAAVPDALGDAHGDCRVYHRRLGGIAEDNVALRVVPDQRCGRLEVDAAFLRRGVLMMALACWPSRPGRAEAARMPELASIADRKWAGVAEALR
jgi:hypothetical protein